MLFANQAVLRMIAPLTLKKQIGTSDAFPLETMGFQKTDGRLIVWKHECLDAMQIQFIEHDFNAFF